MKRVVLPILTVLGGFAVAALLIMTGPTVDQRPTKPLDYQVALQQAKAATSDSQRDDALNRLRIAEATYLEAQAVLARAERDLDRTWIKAPYDGDLPMVYADYGAETLPVTLRARFAGATHEWRGEVVRTDHAVCGTCRLLHPRRSGDCRSTSTQ
ncbi:MAG: hypothetical protein O3A63_13175 [Proteobacteria bacterium]|nr:hypothetical protein [Pseudomonadota bacterium]